MTDDAYPDHEQDTADTPWPPQAMVTPEDFRSVDYNAILRASNTAFDHHLHNEFMNAARAHRSVEPAFSVYRLLGSVCGLHFRVDDRTQVYGAMMSFGNSRTSIPEDWLGDQNDHFFEILDEIEHPALRARLADIVWINDRRKGQAAAIAIAAYCECVQNLADGTFEIRFRGGSHVSMEEVNFIERASQIHHQTKKRAAPVEPHIAALLGTLYKRALEHTDIAPLNRLSNLLDRFSLISMDQLAADMEAAAETAQVQEQVYPLAIKALWALAAYAHAQAKRPDEQRRCQLAGVEQTLGMAPQTGSSSGAAYWHRQAIGELRQITGTEARREELRREMRALQDKALDEMGTFETPFDISDMVSATTEEFEPLTLPEALKRFALLALPGDVTKMREKATQPDGFFSSMMSSAYHDGEGKLISEIEGDPMDGSQPGEARIKSKMVMHLQALIEFTASGRLEPARRLLAGGFPLSERHFRFIVAYSPFVPRHHEASFALGFARLMQGDCLTAGPILIPQLENSLRLVLLDSSRDTSKIRNDLTQEDRSLSTLLEGYRDELVKIFGENNVTYIDLIFNHRPGPALRHEFAHGKVGDQSISDPVIFHACCFIYLLTCWPLMSSWDEHVAPAIENGTF